MTLTTRASGPWAITRHSIDTLTDSFVGWQTTINSTTAWGTANRAIYVPVRVPRRVLVKQLGTVCAGTGTGNIDIGVYDSAGTRLVSTGSTAKIASINTQVINVTDTWLGPGQFYLALNNDTTTDTFNMGVPTAPLCATRGVLTEAVGAVTLPATATWAQDYTNTLMPIITMLLVTEVT